MVVVPLSGGSLGRIRLLCPLHAAEAVQNAGIENRIVIIDDLPVTNRTTVRTRLVDDGRRAHLIGRRRGLHHDEARESVWYRGLFPVPWPILHVLREAIFSRQEIAGVDV